MPAFAASKAPSVVSSTVAAETARGGRLRRKQDAASDDEARTDGGDFHKDAAACTAGLGSGGAGFFGFGGLGGLGGLGGGGGSGASGGSGGSGGFGPLPISGSIRESDGTSETAASELWAKAAQVRKVRARKVAGAVLIRMVSDGSCRDGCRRGSSLPALAVNGDGDAPR